MKIEFNKSQNNSLGLFLGFTGYIIFVVLDSLIKKKLVDQYPIFEIMFFICLFSFIPVTLTLTFLHSWKTLLNTKIHFQLLRGMLGFISGALLVNSFKFHSFSEIYPILFSTPLILTIFSYYFLKEKIGYHRLSAVLFGFVGVLIVSRPGTIHFTWPLFGLFIASFILAINVIIIRKLASSQSSIAFAFYGSLSGLILSAIFASQNFIPLLKEDFFIMFLCGIINGTAILCISGASKLLQSSTFAPIQYVQLVTGFIFGYFFFNDLPDTFETLGSLIIVFSGLYIIFRERNKIS
jgi:drug/metabolite transporter (DMT)-like permease